MLAPPLMPVLPTGFPLTSVPLVHPMSLPKLPNVTISSPKPSIPILIQTRPLATPTMAPGILQSLPPGLIPLPDTPKYDPNKMIVVGPPNVSSAAYHSAQTMQVIDSIPKMKSLPAIVYRVKAATGALIRYLADWHDPGYDTDPDYGISQEWLINARQGDEYTRVPERVPYPEVADAQRVNIPGVTTLNLGRFWYGPPRSTPIEPSEWDAGYDRLLEYDDMQREETDDS